MRRMVIGGDSVGAVRAGVLDVMDPATGEVVDSVPSATKEDVDAAVEAATRAFPQWATTPATKRAQLLFTAAEAIRSNVSEIARLLTAEQGKTLRESYIETSRLAANLEYFAGLTDKVRGAYVPLEDPGSFGLVIRRPVGVVAAIVPWNFPLTLMANKICPALASGCTVVLKPASTTPLATLRCVELINDAGLVPGALNVVVGPSARIGDHLTAHPKVAKIAFTGKTETGMHIMGIAARGIKRVALELGGSDPMIVCDDADLEGAARAAAIGRFFNAGQACLAIKRVYVFRGVADEFEKLLVERAKRMKIGRGTTEGAMMGPLHTAQQRTEVESQVADAVRLGARVLIGGERPTGPDYDRGNFYLPTVLTDVDERSRMVTEEVFGPAVPIIEVTDIDDAIEKANSTRFGLGSSIWTRDLKKARAAAERLDAGYTWVNSLQIAHDELPFGGVKQSGFGKEHGIEAMHSYLEEKSIVLSG